MILMNRKLEYALMVLKHMHGLGPARITSVKEVCEHYKCPFDTTARVMQVMAQQGWMQAEHGVKGGYFLTADVAQISFRDFLEAILGPVEIVKCMNRAYLACDLECTCNVISPMKTLNSRILNLYESISLEDLVTADAADTTPGVSVA